MANVRDYRVPASVAETVQLMSEPGADYALLAGGTSLIGELESGACDEPANLIDLRRLGLDEIIVESGTLTLGAMATLSAVMAHETAGTLVGSALRRAARNEGPLNLRNAATVGGIAAAAACDSEFYAALLALDASIVVANASGEQTTRLAEFYQADGLITAISVPIRPGRSGLSRVARTPSDRPIVAAVAVLDDQGERVALCGVAERPILAGSRLRPPDDYKGSATYRSQMAGILIERARSEAKG